MRSATPEEERDIRPPVAVTAAPSSGVAGRRSVWRRPKLQPRLLNGDVFGFPVHHPYVLRFWTAAIGPGAVADLLRLIAAARTRRTVPYPEHLHLLATAGLVWPAGETIWVPRAVPPLGGAQLRRLTPALRAEHAAQITRFLRPTEPS